MLGLLKVTNSSKKFNASVPESQKQINGNPEYYMSIQKTHRATLDGFNIPISAISFDPRALGGLEQKSINFGNPEKNL